MISTCQYDVFMSYAREDKVNMNTILDLFTKNDLRVWVDQEDIETGDAWYWEIEQAIRASCSVVVLLSPDAAASPHVLDEINIAKRLHKKIYPALLRGDIEDAVPDVLRDLQVLNLQNGSPAERLEGLSQRIADYVASLDYSPRPMAASTMSELVTTLKAAASVLNCTRQGTRACLFWVDKTSTPEKLYMIATTPGFEYEELSFQFEQGRGFVGDVWKAGAVLMADMNEALEKRAADWRLPPEEKAFTDRIGSIIGFPIRLNDGNSNGNGDIIGVLSMDSPAPPAESGLGSEEQIQPLVNDAEELISLIKALPIPPRPISYRRYLNIRNVLRVARLFPPLDVPIRASVFTPDMAEETMRVAVFSQKGLGKGDLTLAFKKGQGLVGEIWEAGKPMFEERDHIKSEAHLMRERNMTADQAANTLKNKSLVGYPLFDGDRMVGVMVLSSTQPMSKSRLTDYDDQFARLASLLSTLLTTTM